MIVALVAGLALCVAALWRGRSGGLPTNLYFLVVVWGIALLALAAMSRWLDFRAWGLASLLLPMGLVVGLAWPAWTRPGTAGDLLPSRESRPWALLVSLFGLAALGMLAFDILRTMGLGQGAGLARALADARMLRQEGGFYPAILLPVNSLRILAAPVAWAVRAQLPEGRLRRLCGVVATVGLLSTLTTTGRVTFVLNVLWMAGISWTVHGPRWGWGGLLRRGALVALAGGAFFVGFGLLIGKSGQEQAGRLLGTAEVPALLSAILSLGLYVLGPTAAAANSTVHANGPEFTANLAYVPLRVLEALGFSMPEFSRSLPYTNIPEPFNTYSFLGPAWWMGSAGGLAIYLALVVLALVLAERAWARWGRPELSFLNGYLLAACVLSLFSDYFFSAGFALLAYALVAGVSLLRVARAGGAR